MGGSTATTPAPALFFSPPGPFDLLSAWFFAKIENAERSVLRMGLSICPKHATRWVNWWKRARRNTSDTVNNGKATAGSDKKKEGALKKQRFEPLYSYARVDRKEKWLMMITL